MWTAVLLELIRKRNLKTASQRTELDLVGLTIFLSIFFSFDVGTSIFKISNKKINKRMELATRERGQESTKK